ncbi:OmpA family protein [Streptomyces sp. NPDC053755]|uniref:OmpA family protein n=1 Tax=Streptomyces sp. NPDC053755 TaxID=3155815 RepID=UPI00343CDD39
MSLVLRALPGRLLIAALALSAAVAGSGCGAFDAPEVRPCAWLDRPSGENPEGAARTAVLVDRSSSTRPGARTAPGAPVPDWGATLVRELDVAALEGGTLSIAGFDGTRATVDWEADRASVSRVEGTDTTKGDRRRARRGCLEERIRTVSAGTPRSGRTDVLGALAAAVDQLGPQAGRRRVVVATDGLVNTGCADLRSLGFDGTAEIDATVARCRTAGELPGLKGVEVALVGIGMTAGGPVPTSPQTTWLTTLWTGLCRAAGAADCRVEATARTRGAGGSDVVKHPTMEPVVTFPAVSERPAGRVTTITIPGSVLFATDTAELSPQARGTLDDAAKRVRELGPLSVAVSGHTDSRGSEERGRRLSLDRAEAVRAALAARGITVLTARGHSDDRPRCTPEYRDGEPDHAAMACNRRVEIAVTVRR